MTLKSAWKRTTLAGLAAVATVGLAACSAQPGVAVQVNDKTYTEQQVSVAAEQLSSVSGQAVSPISVVYLLTQAPAIKEVAEAYGLSFTDEDARNGLSTLEFAGQPANEVTISVARSTQLSNLLQENVGEAAVPQLLEAFERTSIRVNPRYGEVNDENRFFAPSLKGVVLADEQ